MNLNVASMTPTPTSLTLPLPPQVGTLSALTWSESNERLAAVSAAGELLIWDTLNGTCLLHQRVTRTPLRAVAWSRQAKSLLLGGEQGTLSIFHLSTRTLIHSSTFAEPVTQIALSPNTVDTHFFVRSGCTLHLFTQGKPEARVLRYATPLLDACWSVDGQRIALVCCHGLVEVWDVRTRRVVWQHQTSDTQALRVAWDATGQCLAIGMQDGTVQVHEMDSQQCRIRLPLSCFPIQALHWGERYLVAGSAYEVAFWNEAEAEPLRQETDANSMFIFDSQGSMLATACQGWISLATLC
jgi:WD40 repeat protein